MPRRCRRTSILLALWFLRHPEATSSANGAARRSRDTLVQRYRALVELHFREHRPLGFYAEALGVTADHLSRVCRATTAPVALELLHARVLLEADACWPTST